MSIRITAGRRPDRRAVEEVHHTRLERVLRADHHELAVVDHLLEQRRAVPQVVGGRPHVRAHRLTHESLLVIPDTRGDQRLERRPDPVHDRAQIRGVPGRVAHRFERRGDRAALRVSEDHDELRVEFRCGELDAADLRWRDDVARDADDEQVAESLVEDDLCRHP
jgi:hypothetical protein